MLLFLKEIICCLMCGIISTLCRIYCIPLTIRGYTAILHTYGTQGGTNMKI